MERFVAIWDTGATNCVISQAVVHRCGLKQTGVAETHGVHGKKIVGTFLVNLYLPNNIVMPGMKVTEGDLGGADLLIGMNVINQGDFAVTNKNGNTKFSFRIPSNGGIDFVVDLNKSLAMSQKNRNWATAGKKVGKQGAKNRKGK